MGRCYLLTCLLWLLCCCSDVLSQEVLSQTQSAPQQCTTQATLTSQFDWLDPSMALSRDGNTTRSPAPLSRRQQTATLIITDFSFNISLEAVITGISVGWVKWASGTELVDEAVVLVKGGAVSATTNMASSSPWPIVSNITANYGSSNDLWGQSWTPTDVNAVGFGAAISARMPSGAKYTATPNIDAVEITVFYTFPANTEQDFVGSDSTQQKSTSSSTGAIAGGVVTAVVIAAVAAIAVALLFLRRKRTQQRETRLPTSDSESGNSSIASITTAHTKTTDNNSSGDFTENSQSSFPPSNTKRNTQESVYDTMPRTKSMAFLLGAFHVTKKERMEPVGVELPTVDGEDTKITTTTTTANVAASWKIAYDELKIGEMLGSGSFGVVYRGQWRGGDIAVKQILKHKMSEEDSEKCIFEGKLLAELRPHCNIVQFLGMCVQGDKPFCIVTEYMKGGSLYDLLHSDVEVTWSTARHVMKGIAAGMLHLQREGIVHRDLAARNVLLTSDMDPKISDFGMSRYHEGDIISQADSTVGPLKWMSPESLAAGIFSSKSDVWSFGVVLYEISTRQVPYSGLTGAQAAEQVIANTVRLTLPTTTTTTTTATTTAATQTVVVQVMNACLQFRADDRPDFAEISEKFQSME